jgi:cell division protein FtsI (penicillin-binding protein 3)
MGLGLVLVALVGLLVRLANIQLGGHDRWSDRAHVQHWAGQESIPAQRGALLDRRGRLLAHTESFPSVAIDPGVIEDWEGVHEVLERHLGVTREQVARAIDRGSPRFAYLRRHLTDRPSVEGMQAAVRERALRGIVVLEEPRRVYPRGELGAHVLGYTNVDGVGLEGIEKRLDHRLRGYPGKRRTLRDGRGRRIVVAGQPLVEPAPGEDVRLTLDLVIQRFTEDAAQQVWDEFEPSAAIAAVVDVGTGDLLGVACRPTFDPNRPADATAAQRRNRFFTDMWEPGSTFKPIVMGLALSHEAVSLGEQIDCSGGTVTIGRRRVREDDHHDYGVLTPSGVIERSSNVGMVKIGQRLGIERMDAGVREFGFGSRTALHWPGEPDPARQITPLRKWTPAYTLASVSFGQEIAVTPAQLLMSYAALANDGMRPDAQLVLDAERPAQTRVLTKTAARRLAPMLEGVLLRGTGKTARLSDYRVAGKTGTAEKMGPGERGQHVGSFACFGPVEAPRLAVVVLCDDPDGKPYGSRVAAPFATRLLQQALQYLDVPASEPLEPEADVPQEVAHR